MRLLVALLFALTTQATEPVAFFAFPKTTGNFKTASVSRDGSTHHVGTDLMLLQADGMERVLVKGWLVWIEDKCGS